MVRGAVHCCRPTGEILANDVLERSALLGCFPEATGHPVKSACQVALFAQRLSSPQVLAGQAVLQVECLGPIVDGGERKEHQHCADGHHHTGRQASYDRVSSAPAPHASGSAKRSGMDRFAAKKAVQFVGELLSCVVSCAGSFSRHFSAIVCKSLGTLESSLRRLGGSSSST